MRVRLTIKLPGALPPDGPNSLDDENQRIDYNDQEEKPDQHE